MTAKERRDAWLARFQAAIEASEQKWFPAHRTENENEDGSKEASAEWWYRGHYLAAFFIDQSEGPAEDELLAWKHGMVNRAFEDHVETWKWLHEAAE